MFVTNALAQYVVQSPHPTGRNLEGVAFVSPTHGFVAGQNHHLLETFDGGLTWTTRMATALSTDPFYTVVFPDALHGYVAGNNQDAYRTTDGGQTWQPMPNMLAGSVRALDFVTPTRGFAAYNGAISFTPDGGQTWELRSGYPDSPIFFDVSFANEQIGVGSGHRSTPYHDGGIYYTSNGGLSWILVHDVGGPLVRLNEVSLLCAAGADVLRSDDNGLTWYTIAWGWITTGLSGLDRAGNADTLVGVSFSGDIWQSTDLGASWSQRIVGIGVLPAIWEIDAFDEQNAWVVGDSGLTYRTTNGGYDWQLLNNGCGNEITAIDFADDDFGVAVTHRGFVFQTGDRGNHWAVSRLRETGIVFGREEGLRAVDVVDRNLILAGGAGGILFRTDNGGQNWTNYGWPYQPDFNADFVIADIQMIDAQNGWLVGTNGVYSMFRTSDGGYSWVPVPEVVGAVIALDIQGSNIWAITAGTRIYRSTNGGESFTWQGVPGQAYNLSEVEFFDQNNGFVVGNFGYMAKSTNGGATWTALTLPQNESYYSVEMISPTDVFVIGYDSDTFRYFSKRSTNGGTAWTRANLSQYEEWFTALYQRPAGRYWLGGSVGKILYQPGPPLQISLPNDVPPQVPPEQTAQFAVRVVAGEETVVPDSATLWLRRSASAPFEALPLQHVAGDDYAAVLPGFVCSDTPQFYVSAAGAAGTTVSYPANAPTGFLTTRVGVIETADLLATDFESGLPSGWSTTGLWHLTASACLPSGSCGSGAWAYFGQDATCTFNTGARAAGILRSPNFTLPALQPGQHVTLTFCSALDTEYPDGAYGDDDQSQVWWVRTNGQANPINWFTDHRSARTQTFSLDQHAGTTGRLEWRFDTMNTYMNDFRGWHVDNIRVTGPTLVCNDSATPGDIDGDGDVDIQDLATLLASFGVCSGQPGYNPSADLDEDACVTLSDLALLLAQFGN